MRVETKHHPHHSELHLICETFREKKALRNIAKPGEQLIATVGGVCSEGQTMTKTGIPCPVCGRHHLRRK